MLTGNRVREGVGHRSARIALKSSLLTRDTAIFYVLRDPPLAAASMSTVIYEYTFDVFLKRFPAKSKKSNFYKYGGILGSGSIGIPSGIVPRRYMGIDAYLRGSWHFLFFLFFQCFFYVSFVFCLRFQNFREKERER